MTRTIPIHPSPSAAVNPASLQGDGMGCHAGTDAMVAAAKLAASTTTGGGALLVFQKVRDFARLNASPTGTSLIVGCAPLVQDAKLNFVQFFANIGGAVLLKGIIPIP